MIFYDTSILGINSKSNANISVIANPLTSTKVAAWSAIVIWPDIKYATICKNYQD